MIGESTKNPSVSLPVVKLSESEENLYNIEGFAQLHDQTSDPRQLQYDYIEDYEIIETNREYSYYSKHFYDHVRSKDFFPYKYFDTQK
jgi:hypothetical protein